MRTSRVFYIISEAVTIILLILIMIVVYYHIKNNIKKEFKKSRVYQIERTSNLLDAFMEKKKAIFQNFCSISGKREAVGLLHEFSDVYTLDGSLKIRQILKKTDGSAVQPGYDFSGSSVAPFFRSINSSECLVSGMFRSSESNNISVYIASKQDGVILASRVSLSKLSMDFALFAGYRDDTILFASDKGEVLASSRDKLETRTLPDDTEETIMLDREYFITKRFNRSIDGMIVLLTPVSTVFYPLEVTRKYIVYFIFILLAYVSLRLMLLYQVLIQPLEKFMQMLADWGLEDRPAMQANAFFRIREFDILYNTFFEKTRQVRDSIIQLREDEKELESMRQYLKSIIDSMPSIIISVDMNARVTEWNRAAAEFTGITAADAADKPIWHMIPELGRYSDAFYEVLSRNELREFKKQVFNKNEKIYLDITIFPVTGLESVAAAIRIDDITMIEKAEKNLRQAQKMEIISTLSTGLAHDFNNVLGGILGAASLMKKKINGSADLDTLRESISRYLDIIETSSNRATAIITRLLSLSMRQEVEFRPTDLNIVARNVESICRNSFDKSVEIFTIIPDTPVIVNADSNQIEQVMLNLCINAVHSMTIMRPDDQPQGGRLIINVTDRIAGAQLSADHSGANQSIYYTSFSVSDEGVGIESSRLKKIFEPFYTTKSKTSGSGLGLSMAYNIIRLHGGFIEVKSAEESGSEFTVYLPLAENSCTDSIAERSLSGFRGQGTLLVIDDEPVIRELASDILTECGYTVITAPGGTEALDIFSKKSATIDLVLLDLMMPGMSGLDTFGELLKIDPHVKVLMSSGFVQDERIGKAALMGAVGFIHKPYTTEKLSEAVCAILETNPV